MEDFDKIRRLLAQRAQRAPEASYCERFLEEFRERQRREALSVSAPRLLWERTETWLVSRGGRGWFRWGGAGAAVIGAGAFACWLWLPAAHEEPSSSGGAGPPFGGFSEAALEPSGADLMEPSLVEIGWSGREEETWTPGFQVAEGMFVSAFSDARLLEPVQVRSPGDHAAARIVMRDPRSGLVVIDARQRPFDLSSPESVGR